MHQGAGDGAFEYDPANDSWRTLAPMNGPRASVGVAMLGGKIHVVGGRGLDAVTVATHEVYVVGGSLTLGGGGGITDQLIMFSLP